MRHNMRVLLLRYIMLAHRHGQSAVQKPENEMRTAVSGGAHHIAGNAKNMGEKTKGKFRVRHCTSRCGRCQPVCGASNSAHTARCTVRREGKAREKFCVLPSLTTDPLLPVLSAYHLWRIQQQHHHETASNSKSPNHDCLPSANAPRHLD